MPQWVYGAIVTVALALLAYLVKGLITWGHVTGALEQKLGELTEKTNKTNDTVEKIQSEMLRPSDLRAAISDMQLQVYRDIMAKRRPTGGSDGE